jgi:uncharacterized protein
MPYKRRFFPQFTCLLLALAAFALGGGTAQAATACVWRVTNVPVPFYLVGTVHALSGNDYPLPKAYNQALRDSQRLLFEVDPRPKNDWSELFARAAHYPKGDSMRRHVHPQTWNFLVKNFRISNVSVDDLEHWRPWAIAYFVWGVHGYNDAFSEHGADHHLAYQAQRLGKEVGGIESNEEHVEVLRGLSHVDSEVILLDAIVRGDKRRDDFNRVRAAWKKGDVATIWAENLRFRNLSPGADLRLLDERNVKWIPRIKAEMKTGKPTAIVAGTLHFCGPNGVVRLLQRGGYTVEQL